MHKKLVALLLGFVVAASLFVAPSVFGQSAATGTPGGERNFCPALVDRVAEIERKTGERRDKLALEIKEREDGRTARWQRYLDERARHRTEQDARFAAHIAKLNDRAATDEQKLSVAAFQSAMRAAIDARRAAVDAAVDAFQNSVQAAFDARRTTLLKAFDDRIVAFRTAGDKAKLDCTGGIASRTVRTAFLQSLKTAQDQFKAARKANDDFKQAMEKARVDKKAAFKEAHDDFKAALEAARMNLKKVFGEGASTSTPTSTP